MSKKKNRPHGHYCKICGEYKANEKFSGKGHAAHICKACSRLSAAEKAAAMDRNRLMNLPMKRLSESEKKWLESKIHDKCPEVADTAREVYNVCFPYAERNAMKNSLLSIHCPLKYIQRFTMGTGIWNWLTDALPLTGKAVC